MCISSRNQIENSEEYLYKLLSINSEEYVKLRDEVFPNKTLNDNSKDPSSNYSLE